MYTEVDMPEHDLEPPRFSRHALQRLLNDWSAVRATIMSGWREESGIPPTAVFEDQAYMRSQSGTALLDKFTHCLLVKCSVEVRFFMIRRKRNAITILVHNYTVLL